MVRKISQARRLAPPSNNNEESSQAPTSGSSTEANTLTPTASCSSRRDLDEEPSRPKLLKTEPVDDDIIVDDKCSNSKETESISDSTPASHTVVHNSGASTLSGQLDINALLANALNVQSVTLNPNFNKINEILLPSSSSGNPQQTCGINVAELLVKLLGQSQTPCNTPTLPSVGPLIGQNNIIHIPQTGQQLISLNGSNLLCNSASAATVMNNGGMQITIPLSSLIAAQDLSSLNTTAVLQPQLLTPQQQIITLSPSGVNIIGGQPSLSIGSNGQLLPNILNAVPMFLCADNRPTLDLGKLTSSLDPTVTMTTGAIDSKSGMGAVGASRDITPQVTSTHSSTSSHVNGGGGTAGLGHSNPTSSSPLVQAANDFVPSSSSITTNGSTIPVNLNNLLKLTPGASSSSAVEESTIANTSPGKRLICPYPPPASASAAAVTKDSDGSSGGGNGNSMGNSGVSGNKLERKRARNRDAARKCRERKLSLIHRLENELSELHENHRSLQSLFEGEKGNVDILKAAIREHKNKGCHIHLTENAVPEGPVHNHNGSVTASD